MTVSEVRPIMDEGLPLWRELIERDEQPIFEQRSGAGDTPAASEHFHRSASTGEEAGGLLVDVAEIQLAAKTICETIGCEKIADRGTAVSVADMIGAAADSAIGDFPVLAHRRQGEPNPDECHQRTRSLE